MRQLSYDIDTSVWNFLLEDDRPAERAMTEQLFQQLPTLGRMAISELVIEEIARAMPVRRDPIRGQWIEQDVGLSGDRDCLSAGGDHAMTATAKTMQELHRIREQITKDYEGLSTHEFVERLHQAVEAFLKERKMTLKQIPPPSHAVAGSASLPQKR